LTASGRDGSALLFSLMPTFAEDEEFAENLEEYRTELSLGLHDVVKAGNIMAVLCDNAYRRIKDDACSAHIKLNIDKTGNLTRIPKTQLDAGKYIPQTVVCGEFSIIAQTGPAPVYKPAVLIEHSDFVGQYPINPGRSLNAREKLLVPKLPAWYIIPKEVVSICQHAVKTSEKAMPMRNFLLRGPAGTGKTMGAQAIAAGLGLPYVKYTCSANTEIFDFVGQVFPDTARATTGDAELDKELEGVLLRSGYDVNRLVEGKRLVLITGHRRENFGDGFIHMCTAIKDLTKMYPEVDFVYPMHLNPNVRKPIHEVFGEDLSHLENMFFIEPLEYLSFVYLMEKSTIVLTDSGGIQEEAPGLGKPVLVMRDTTERPEALAAGTVKLVGTDYDKIVSEVSALLDDTAYYDAMSKAVNPYGDGLACGRIVEFLNRKE